MKIIADLQIHSRFSRATSPSITIANLEKYARLKGLNLLGTGDFTHPKWLAELKKELKEDGSGILTSESGFHFVLQGEISNIYTQDGKQRRIHNLLLAKNFEVVEQINKALLKKGRLDYDGRPIFGFSCIELVEMMKEIDDGIEIIPAHCLLPGTIVHSNPKLTPIEHLKIGDVVLTHNGSYRKINAVHKRHYKGTIYHIKPRYFRLGLTTTDEHPFLAIKTLKNCSWTSGICKPTYPHIKRCVTRAFQKYKPEWMQAKNLEIGDVLLYPRLRATRDVDYIKIGKDNIKVDKDFCRLVGYYLAEGYSNRRDCIGFSFNKNEFEFVDDVKALTKSVFKAHPKKGKTRGDIIVYSNKIRDYFEQHFYQNNTKKASTKSLPEWMLYLPIEKQVEIFKGWWYGDKGSTSSRTLMNQLKIICLRLGIVPSIRVDTAKSHKLRGKHTIKERVITAQHDNYVLDKLTFFEDTFALLENKYFNNQKRKKEWKYGWIDNKYAYLPILKITKKHYSGFVYNLEVENDNSFVTEFATIHNCWTPWYGIFGSMSGFDSVEECFKDQAKHIYAIETGLSSDPSMNWRLSKLDKYTLLSSSDAHCVHPDTFITLENGHVSPISQISDELIIPHADLNNMSYKNGIKIQHTKVPSPNVLKEIKYAGGQIKVSPLHRFYVYDNGAIKEKHALEIKKGALLIRLARIHHDGNESILLKKPDIAIYYRLQGKGLGFIKSQREKLNFTQKHLAKLLGVYKDHYWKIENNKIKINERILRKLGVILKFNYRRFIKNHTKNDLHIDFPVKSSIKLFELLGYFIGDGCLATINKGRCLILTDKNKRLLQYYSGITKEIFSCNTRLFKYKKQKSYGLVIPAAVARFFQLNFTQAVLRGKERQIPKEIFSSSLNEISGLLRGFFDAEGSLDDHGVKVCSANKLLIYQIDSLLKKFNILSSIYLYQLEKIKQKYRHNLILYGENLRKFFEEINFNHPLKKSKLEKYVANLKIKRKSKIKRIGDFVISEVKSVKDVKSDVEYLYDISVPGYENYIANQIVVHNSFWPWRLGRECNVFEFKEYYSYDNILDAIRKRKNFTETIEMWPHEGKYHYTGHRNCDVCLSPKESIKLKNICPKCRKLLTVGVAQRVESLADRADGFVPKNAVPFKNLIPLSEVIAETTGHAVSSKQVWEEYYKLANEFGNELNVLLEAEESRLKKTTSEKIAKNIIKNRNQKIPFKPGYDGVYGIPIFEEKDEMAIEERNYERKFQQKGLDEFM